MTVSSFISRLSFACNGVTTQFQFPHYFLSETDLVVIHVVNATGVETTLTLTTDYTVSGEATPTSGVVTTVATYASGITLVVERNTAKNQPIDLVENDNLPAETVEQGFDRPILMLQELTTLLSRAMTLSAGTTSPVDLTLPNPVASKLLSFNSTADGLTLADFIDNIYVRQEATPATDGSVYLWLKPSTGAFYFMDGAAWVQITDITTLLGMQNTWTKTQSWSRAADITPGTAIVLGDDGNYVTVFGSGDITSISAVGVGTVISFRFIGGRTLVHSEYLRLPWGGSNVVTALGDMATFVEHATGQWICISYQRADGTALTASPDTHKILQVVDIENYIYGSSTAIIPDDDTIPQITEGWEVLSGTFTPLSATSRLHITFTGNVTASVSNHGVVALFDGSDSARKAVNITPAGAGYISTVAFDYTVARGSTVPVTFSVRYGSASGATWYKNGYGSRKLGGVQGLTLRITEVEA